MKYVIVGGVAGGATAAARLRRLDETADIVLLERGGYISYANCGLPYYIGGVIAERERLLLQTPESFGRRYGVDVRVGHEAVGLDTEAHSLSVRTADGRTYAETYDRLLLSPGADPVRPPLEGIDEEGVFTLRNVADTDRIKAYMASRDVRSAVVVGGGFIGLEMAENLVHAGAAVTLVEMGNQVMAPLDYSMAAPVAQHLVAKGVALRLESAVEAFRRDEGRLGVVLRGGEVVEADLVLLSIGVRPATTLAREAGLRIGEAGGIWVDETLATSAPDVYAVGDAIEFPHPLTGRPWLNYLAGPANRQAHIAADNMALGAGERYEGSLGTSIAKVFDLTVASTGMAAKRLQREGIAYRSSVTHSSSHAGYYPGALPLTIKLTYAPDSGRLLGAQVVGCDGVDKRIDELAQLMKHGGTVYDLAATEHAYAPPFSSAKDPVAIAGYVASNVLSGAMPALSWRELRAEREEVVLIDVRTPEEFALGTIEGAVNIPLDDLRSRLGEVPADRPVVVFCAVGLRGYVAARLLMGRGYRNVRNLLGGYRTYSAAVAPLPEPVPSACRPGQPSRQGDAPRRPSDGKPVAQKIDACGLQCPGPILCVKTAMDGLGEGERIEVTATDPAFARDVEAWCASTGNTFVGRSEEGGRHTVVLERGNAGRPDPATVPAAPKGKTFVMFSDDLDRALATFVMANGAAATGQHVTIFFTFWGLNVIKKERKPRVAKDLMGRMFGWMMPSSSRTLPLSKMNMLGLGWRMMRQRMKDKRVDSLEAMRSEALRQGVEFIACQMSMDVMGVGREELLDEVTLGGVATYMERADKANVNLFI